MEEYSIGSVDDKLLTFSNKDHLKLELDNTIREIKNFKEDFKKNKQEIIEQYEHKIKSIKAEISERLQKLFEKKTSKLQSTGESDPRRNLEERIRKQLEARYSIRLREEKSKITIEIRQKIEAEMKRDAAKKLSQSESELRRKVIAQLEEEIRREMMERRNKEIQKQCSTLALEYKTQADEYVRKLKGQELKTALMKKLNELKNEASVRISEASTEFKKGVEAKLQAHMSMLNARHNEEIIREKEDITIQCAKVLETEQEKKKLSIVLHQFKEQIARSLKEQLRNQLEPEIKTVLMEDIRREINRRSKEDLNRKIAEIKRKAKIRFEERAEEIKKKWKETVAMKIKEATANEEAEICSRIRQEFELDRREAQFNIDKVYEEKYETEHAKIEQNLEELRKIHSALASNIRKLQAEKKSTIEEYEIKEFDLTKQEIEIKNQLESVEREKQSRSMMKKQYPKEPQKNNTFLTYRDPLKENSLNYSYQGMKGRNECEFTEELSRILPSPDELVDKAINDIGFDDIIAKIMEGGKGDTRKDDFLIESKNELNDIIDY